ncbi:MAG: clan AA aspartic protease [Janthinobacterium lividum]
MIIGSVNSYREATIQLPVRSATMHENQIEVILDTGFSGSLTLPPNLITALSLPFRSRGSATLADGSEAQFDIYAATIIWDGAARNILVESADTDPLVGMSLLYGFNINIQAIDGGKVTIEHLVI